jgi:hypothetical protein
VPLRTGYALGKNQWAPLDDIEPAALVVYRTIVVRRSPAESRPPAGYTLRFAGRYYDVWQRPLRPRSQLVADATFGTPLSAGGRPDCAAVRRLAAAALGRRATLAAAVRAPAAVAALSGPTTRPTIAVPAAGVYDAWLRGSFARELELSIDGRRLGSVRDERSFAGQWVRIGARQLRGGPHRIRLRYTAGVFRPGGGSQPPEISAVALVPREPRPHLVQLAAPVRARELCALPLDWVEVVAPA